MTTQITTDTPTCIYSVLRGVGRKAHHEFCGRDATHVDRLYGVNFYCKRHAGTKSVRAAIRRGSVVALAS